MDRLQHLLVKLAEERSEISQIALKTAQFGPDGVIPGTNITNFQKCHLELDDLLGVVEMLNEEFSFGYTPNRANMNAKKAKVREYLEYSIKLGFVKDERNDR